MGKRDTRESQIGWRMAGLGGEVASYLGAGLLLGWGFEAWLGGDWWIIGGAIVGLVTGLSVLVRGALKLNKELDAIAGISSSRRPGPDDPASGGGGTSP